MVLRRWLALAASSALAACGPEAAPEGIAGSSSTTGDEPGTTGDSTGLVTECEPFADAIEPGTPVAIRIVNVGDEPILLDSPCPGHEYVALATASGLTWPEGFCESTCAEQFEFGCGACGPCPTASYTIAMPGHAAEIEWPGHLYARVSPPETCFDNGSCMEPCPQRRVDLLEPIEVAVAAVSYEDCVGAEDDASVCRCANGVATCNRTGSQRIEPSLHGSAIHQPGTPGPIVVEIAG